MTLETLKLEIEAGFEDAEKALNFINEAVPFLEAAAPKDAVQIQSVQDAANHVAPLVAKLLASGDLTQPQHDTLQNRIGAVANPAIEQTTLTNDNHEK